MDFQEMLPELGGGLTLTDLNESMDDALDSVRRTGKAATVTLTITLEPNGEDRVSVKSSATSKLPKSPNPTSYFFITASGALTRKSPRQMEIEEFTQR